MENKFISDGRSPKTIRGDVAIQSWVQKCLMTQQGSAEGEVTTLIAGSLTVTAEVTKVKTARETAELVQALGFTMDTATQQIRAILEGIDTEQVVE